MLMIRFEMGSENRITEPIGPFKAVTIVGHELVGHDGNVVAVYDAEQGVWKHNGEEFSDVVIFQR